MPQGQVTPNDQVQVEQRRLLVSFLPPCAGDVTLHIDPLHVSGVRGKRQFILFLQNKIWSCSSVVNSSGNAMKRGSDAKLSGHTWYFCLLHVAAWVCSPGQELAVPSLLLTSIPGAALPACSEKTMLLHLDLPLWFSLSKI